MHMVQTQLSSTRIVSGAGVVATVGNEARNLGMQTVLLLIDPFIAKTPAGQAIATALSAAGHVEGQRGKVQAQLARGGGG